MKYADRQTQSPALQLLTQTALLELLILLPRLHQVVMVAEFSTPKCWFEVVWRHTEGWILLVLVVPVVCKFMPKALQVQLDVVMVSMCCSVQLVVCLTQQVVQHCLIRLSTFTQSSQQL
jgi:hypothetical protein